MITRWAAGAALAAFVAGAASASETPLYQAAPGWVEAADALAIAPKSKGPLVLFDRQQRIEGDRVTTYVDTAIRLDSPEALTQLGTLGAAWLPDKGDLVIHRAELLRAGKAIDLLAGGAKFTVLRREQQLEQRSLDGMLTATMPVAGARVGDIVRLSYSFSKADGALGGNVQSVDLLPPRPFEAGFARFTVSWPQDRAIRFAARPDLTLPEAASRGGEKRMTIVLPLAKQKDMPEDSPTRYRLPPQLQMSSFAGWEDVSRTFAKVFATEGALAADKDLAGEVAKIAAASADPVERMAAALRLVQDRISYLANGMNGGNYVPQSAATTWEARYGDCKAKTLLLIAMLRELGIEADPVLVNSAAGDAVAVSLPMAAAFDHVIARVRVDGRDYWLDGTQVGTRRAQLSEAPGFRFGLPLTAAGSGLIPIVASVPEAPQYLVRNRIDQSAGIDFPAMIDATVIASGPQAAPLRQLADLPAGEQRDAAIAKIIGTMVGEVRFVERSIAADPATGAVILRGKGLQTSAWQRDERRATFEPMLVSNTQQFAPDRGREAWRPVPVELGAPERFRYEIEIVLPEQGRGMTLENPDFHGEAAGVRIDRTARIAAGTLTVNDEASSAGGEIAPDRIAAARASSAMLAAAKLRLRAPDDALRRWQFGAPAMRRKLKPIEDVYARLIADDPDDAEHYTNRAGFLSGIGDYRGALADLNKALALDASADGYARRANAYWSLGELDKALADVRSAEELAPDPAHASDMATLLGQSGKAAEGLTLVEEALDNPGESKIGLVATRAEMLARLGRKDEGLAALTALLADRPGDSQVFNSLCWYRALWAHALDDALADCNRAIEGSTWTPPALDSRALANLRLGRLDAALADADAALGQAGGQTQTLLLRGIIRTKLGDAAGQRDIAEALRRRPGLKREYEGYGLLP